MDLNSIFKFGSKVDVLLSAYKSQTIGSTTLINGEPFLKINNVSVDFDYSKVDNSVSNRGEHYLTNNYEVPSRITISGVPLNDRVTSLICERQLTSVLKTKYETVECENHTIVLDAEEVKDLFVYGENRELVLNLTNAGKIVENENLTSDSYIVFYKTVSEGTCYSLKSPHISYMTVEIFGEGNVDDTKGSLYMKFLRCALNSSAKATIDYTGTTNTISLVFDIIDGQQTSDNIMIIE